MSVQGITSDMTDTTARAKSAAAKPPRRKARGSGTSVAIGISLAVHAAIAAYVVTTQFTLKAPEIKETDPVLVEMVPLRKSPPPRPAVTSDQPKPETPVVEPKPVIQPRETPPPVTQPLAPLNMAPVKTAQPQPPVAAPAAAKAAPAATPQPRNDFVGVDVDMALSNNPPPPYPPQAKARHEEGTVQLRLQVRADGSVGEVQVQSSSGSMRLDRAAIDAVKRWKFRAATKGGQPVDSWAVVPITFGFKRGDGGRGRDHHGDRRGRPGGHPDRPFDSEQTSGDTQ
ncbi:energy transducer TonB [Asticcacaulis sp. AND118]|uniref:energy transducer TonB n=1 Tax=Asticcacaulis sp. AND118 TaxID=2840468 RepID=UPI001CFFC442|nr:energy transducer TonB [Asticcacaulis sp. AND118]UDF05104.1 energy transducer TonB [Asticcacaulis sp. AND118]